MYTKSELIPKIYLRDVLDEPLRFVDLPLPLRFHHYLPILLPEAEGAPHIPHLWGSLPIGFLAGLHGVPTEEGRGCSSRRQEGLAYGSSGRAGRTFTSPLPPCHGPAPRWLPSDRLK